MKCGDTGAFQRFALQVQSLVGLLKTLGPEGEIELRCGSHVMRLLSKLSPEQRTEFRQHIFRQSGTTHTLYDLSDWLRYVSQVSVRGAQDRQNSMTEQNRKTITVLHGTGGPSAATSLSAKEKKKAKGKAYCPFCDNNEHYLSQCSEVAKLSTDQLKEWIRANKRCCRCARPHQAAQCNLKKPCSFCQGKHLQPLHEVNARLAKEAQNSATTGESCLTSSASEILYLDKPVAGKRVMLKLLPVLAHYGNHTLDTFAILDDGSERTMLLPAAANTLSIQGTPEELPLRTVQQDIQVLQGSSVILSLLTCQASDKLQVQGCIYC